MVNTILKEADLFCPNSVRINFTIYHIFIQLIICCNLIHFFHKIFRC
ncbi:ABC transporter ATP-binding protein [Lentilactobacillus buchneri]|nr:ABC transporter ATP-binding protein [Lentilactobacillus buchneri]